ncbi:MAG: oxidoreductase [Planctomycetaceae bacterium]|nr:oxidoreductase [Planctomycetaceae bacterium]
MINVGISGIGFMGWIHYLAYQKTPGARIKAICTRNEAKRNGDWTSIQGNFGPPGQQVDVSDWTCYSDIDDLIADESIDLIDICLPPDLHADVAKRALQAGKHVLIEKPMALTAEDCEAIVAAANENNRQALVAHVLPFFPEYAYLRNAVSSGQYGKLLGGHFNRVISDPLWLGKDFWDEQKVGGPLIDLHVHDAHLIRYLFGMPTAVNTRGRFRDAIVEYCSTLFEFEDTDLLVTSNSGVVNQQGRTFMHNFEAHFEKATMQFSYAGLNDTPEVSPCKVFDSENNVLRPELGSGDPVDSFVMEIQEVISAIESGQPSSLLSGELARDAITLCYKQAESAENGTRVTL